MVKDQRKVGMEQRGKSIISECIEDLKKISPEGMFSNADGRFVSELDGLGEWLMKNGYKKAGRAALKEMRRRV